MKEENRRYAEEAFEIVEHAAKKIGSRLPGSDGEKEYAAYMGDKLRSIGIEPVREEFAGISESVDRRHSVCRLSRTYYERSCLCGSAFERGLVRYGACFGCMLGLAYFKRFSL